jgi:hypothetical protein|nr:MAG TPA: hypothetical protein [Caudoviricetes sp.]
MKYKVVVYYDGMEDSEHIFSNKNDAIFNTAYEVLNIATQGSIRLKWWRCSNG